MTKFFNIALLAAALGACASSGPAAAQVICTANGSENVAGTCMTRGFAASMRLRSLVMNQQKIGYNFPMPPRLDNTYPKNFDVNRYEFSQPGNFSTNPFPPSP
jgi:hypothetical protein